MWDINGTLKQVCQKLKVAITAFTIGMVRPIIFHILLFTYFLLLFQITVDNYLLLLLLLTSSSTSSNTVSTVVAANTGT